MLHKLHKNIFLLIISLALFLDAINVDTLFTSHCMIREEYTGQISEIYNSHNNEKFILYSYSTTAGNRSFQQVNKSTQPICLIDEDSVSLAPQPTMSEEVTLYLCGSSNIRYAAPHVPLFDFYSLCKLQI